MGALKTHRLHEDVQGSACFPLDSWTDNVKAEETKQAGYPCLLLSAFRGEEEWNEHQERPRLFYTRPVVRGVNDPLSRFCLSK